MKELTYRLLSLINENKTINEISIELGISNKQIYNLITTIKNKGLEYKRNYFSSGDIIYSLNKDIEETSNLPKEEVILTRRDEYELNFLVLSDLHIGSKNERIDLLNKAYEYASKKDIHLIIITGDLIDGISFGGDKKHTTNIDQIDYFFRIYPFDKNILTFAVLGDHDFDSLKYGIDFEKVLNSYRHDIVTLGYKQGIIRIKNDRIFLNHRIRDSKANIVKEVHYDAIKGETLALEGHNHMLSLYQSPKCYQCVGIPSLSNISKYNIPPSMVLMTLNFYPENGLISNAIFKQLLLEPEIVKFNKLNLDLSRGKEDIVLERENEIDCHHKILRK